MKMLFLKDALSGKSESSEDIKKWWCKIIWTYLKDVCVAQKFPNKFSNFRDRISPFKVIRNSSRSLPEILGKSLEALEELTGSLLGASFVPIWAHWMFARILLVSHMWLVALPNPCELQQSWECIFLKHYSHMNTKWALGKKSINGLLRNCHFKIFT